MDFNFTEEQLMIQQAARDFAQNECLPGVIERDEKQIFPKEQVEKLADLGFLGMMVKPEYGGAGMDTVSYVLAMEEISKVDASTAVVMSVNNSLVCYGLQEFGTEEQKQKYLMPLAQGKKDGQLYIGAFMLSEPEAGSDATHQRTIAEDKGDHYLLNGTKNWITNGGTACVYLVMAQTDASKGSRGINTLIVEKNWPGVTVAKKENKLAFEDITGYNYPAFPDRAMMNFPAFFISSFLRGQLLKAQQRGKLIRVFYPTEHFLASDNGKVPNVVAINLDLSQLAAKFPYWTKK